MRARWPAMTNLSPSRASAQDPKVLEVLKAPR